MHIQLPALYDAELILAPALLLTAVCCTCCTKSRLSCPTSCRPVPRLRNHATQSARNVTEFEDDVSGWGRQVMEDQDYEDDEMSHASLSSGLSPRESRPRTRPWDLAEGYKVPNPMQLLSRHHNRACNNMSCSCSCTDLCILHAGTCLYKKLIRTNMPLL